MKKLLLLLLLAPLTLQAFDVDSYYIIQKRYIDAKIKILSKDKSEYLTFYDRDNGNKYIGKAKFESNKSGNDDKFINMLIGSISGNEVVFVRNIKKIPNKKSEITIIELLSTQALEIRIENLKNKINKAKD